MNQRGSGSGRDIIERVIQLRRKHFGPRGKARFARALGISPSTYSYYEKNRVPPPSLLVQMARLTGANLDWLLTGSPGEGPVGDAGERTHDALTSGAETKAVQPERLEGPMDAAREAAGHLAVIQRLATVLGQRPGAAAAPKRRSSGTCSAR